MNKTKELTNLLVRQLALWGDLSTAKIKRIDWGLDIAVSATQKVLDISTAKSKFDHYHSQHYLIMLYKLAHYLHKAEEGDDLPERLYLLNRMLNSVDLYYKIDMPDYFIAAHGVGTVFSNASYGNYLVIFQNVTIGKQDNSYPRIGERVVIYPNSVISGNSVIGENSVIGAGTILINKIIPPNSLVYCRNGEIVIKKNLRNEIKNYFEI